MSENFQLLLIEDDSVEREKINATLDGGFVHLIKYQVHSELGLNELPQQHYDAAIIDIDTLNQERAPCEAIVAQLNQLNPDCLIMALTADLSEGVIKPLLEINVRKIISKPCSEQDILLPLHRRVGMNFQDFQQRVNYEHRIIDKKVSEIKELVTLKADEEGAQQLFSKKLEQLAKFVMEHFSIEERHMALYSYPDIDLHQEQHRSLLEEIKEMVTFSGDHRQAAMNHLEILNRVEIKLNHDQHFMDFVTHLNYLHNVYATS
jgi:hemerythrin